MDVDRFDAAWLDRALDALHDGVIIADATDLVVRNANPAAHLLLRRPDLVGTNMLELVHPDDLERAAAGIALRSDPWAQQFDLRGRTPATRFRGVAGDGEEVPLELSMTTVPDPDSRIVITFRPLAVNVALDEAVRLLAVGSDLRDALSCAAEGYAHPFVPSKVGIAYDEIAGATGRSTRRSVGPLPERLAGILGDGSYDSDPETPWSRAELTGAPVVTRSPDELPADLRAAATAHGLSCCIAIPIDDPATDRAACLVVWCEEPHGIDHHLFLLQARPTDVVRLALQRRAQAWQIEHAAHHDALTDLLNRRAFFDPLSVAEPPFALLYIDLDGFKAVNDRVGHTIGDHVLAVTARRLQHAVREGDVIARLGGDEFAVLATRLDDLNEAESLAARLIQQVSEPITSELGVVRVGASVGIAVVAGPGRASSDDTVVKAADGALYEAKGAGRGTWRLTHVR